MKKIASLFMLLMLLGNTLFAQQTTLKLWYKNPANASVPDNLKSSKDDAEWLKALPIGNGNLGGMVFGDVNKERIQLNEKTLWSGSNDDNDNPDAPKYINEIRALLFAGKFKEATELTNKTQICKGVGSGNGSGADDPFGCFQTLGDLWLDFGKQSAYTNYYRDLNLNNAIANVSYLQDGINFKREYFVNTADNCLVIRLTADKKNAISFSAMLNRPERFITANNKGELVMSGTLNNGKGGNGMEYMARLKAISTAGKQSIVDNKIVIEKADEVVLYLTASTDYLNIYPVYKGNDYQKITRNNLDKATAKTFSILKAGHIKDYQYYFNRVSLQLSPEKFVDDIPTNERLANIKKSKNDNYLSQLYFQYGRYLLISSTRENTLPANLQGIWANKIQTPWNSDYHTDINVQMNYWLAENTNLSDLHLSLTKFIQSIEKPATKSASVQFGLNGWGINPIVNVWGFTSPGEHPSWGLTFGASGWICQHLWEHYAFTKDKKYLASVFPTLKGAAKFYMGWLVADKETGKLVSGPSSSPENNFVVPNSNGYKSSISMGPSHDQEIIEELFTNIIQAAEILNDKDPFVDELKLAKANLLKPQISADGRVQEWAKFYEEPEPGHRHLSHLYALYPGNAFNNVETPAFVEASQKSLEYRLKNGGAHTGWSAAWVTNLWARLKNGDKALYAFNEILIKKSAENLFDLHPPFQIDGNFGSTAGIAEMLIQSHEGNVSLLPALPTAWQDGEVKGLCARGGYVVDMKWKAGKLITAKIYAKVGGLCKVKYGNELMEIKTQAGKWYTIK